MQYVQKPRWEVYNTAIRLTIAIVVVLLVSSATSAQTVTFKHRIDNGLDNFGLGVIETDSGYIMYGSGWPASQQNGVSIKFFKTDLLGNITGFREYGSPDANWSPGYGNSAIPTYDGNYALAGTRVFATGHRGLLMKFDQNLDTLWTKSFPSSRELSLYQCRETSDRGFVLVGANSGNDPFSNILLIKTDSLGNELWRREYGGIYRDIGKTAPWIQGAGLSSKWTVLAIRSGIN